MILLSLWKWIFFFHLLFLPIILVFIIFTNNCLLSFLHIFIRFVNIWLLSLEMFLLLHCLLSFCDLNYMHLRVFSIVSDLRYSAIFFTLFFCFGLILSSSLQVYCLFFLCCVQCAKCVYWMYSLLFCIFWCYHLNLLFNVYKIFKSDSVPICSCMFSSFPGFGNYLLWFFYYSCLIILISGLSLGLLALTISFSFFFTYLVVFYCIVNSVCKITLETQINIYSPKR